MSFIFATSHLPEDNRPLEEDEEDDVQPMLRAGGVRALSHLRPAQGEPAAPRPTTPAYIPAWITEALHAEHQPGLETGPGSRGDFASHAIARGDGATGLHALSHPLTLLNSRPLEPRGGMRPEPAAQQPQQLSGEQGRFSGDSRSGSPGTPYTDTPPEPSARGAADGQHGDTWGDRPPPTRPDSSSSATGPGFDGRGTPGAFSPQQGMQRFQAAAPAQQKPGGAGPIPPAPQAPQPGQPPAPQALKSLPQYRSDEIAKDKEIEDLKKASSAPEKEIDAQKKYVQKLKNTNQPKSRIKQAEAKLAKMEDPRGAGLAQARNERAVISRKRESVEQAAQLINSTRNPGEDTIDAESIDENSPEYKDRVAEALCRLHGGTAPWMDHLADHFGENEEAKDGAANPGIKKFINNVDPTDLAWCGFAAATAMKRSGIAPPPGAASASSWHAWGKPVGPEGPNVGDVYHIDYGDGSGHVSTVVGVSKDGTQVFCLGGNQNDGLNISAYPAKNFGKAKVAIRRPPGQQNNIPAPTFDYNADLANFSILARLTR